VNLTQDIGVNATDELDSFLDSPTPAGLPQLQTVRRASRNLSSTSSTSASTPAPQSIASTLISRTTSTSQKGRGKRTRQEAFADENKAETEVLAALAAEKHTRKMAEHAQRMAELEIKKQRLNLEANEKRMQAEERRIIAQHQREREKEVHDMQMLRLRLQYQDAGAPGVGPFRTTQFGDNEDFAGAGLRAQTDFGLPSLPPFNG
jgi:hypothetical protein